MVRDFFLYLFSLALFFHLTAATTAGPRQIVITWSIEKLASPKSVVTGAYMVASVPLLAYGPTDSHHNHQVSINTDLNGIHLPEEIWISAD